MSLTVENLHNFLRLTGGERKKLAFALVFLPLIALGLRWIGFRRVQRALSIRQSPATTGAVPQDFHEAKRLGRLVTIAARHGVCQATCLPVALTLAWMLRREGIQSELRLGVRKDADRLEAHAWVELEGVPLIGSAQVRERFAAFEPIDAWFKSNLP